MKIAKRILICICVVALVFTLPVKTEAYERDEHDKLMLDVLFKHFKEIDNDKSVQDEIKAIECACYLTIDQFNESGQKALDTLNDYGVKGIPKNISGIKISASPNTHRSYTHRGWDYPYSGVQGEQWPNRQAVMVNTVGTIFDFNGDTKKQESFCKLLYYIHILGDHMDDTSYKINNENIIINLIITSVFYLLIGLLYANHFHKKGLIIGILASTFHLFLIKMLFMIFSQNVTFEFALIFISIFCGGIGGFLGIIFKKFI